MNESRQKGIPWPTLGNRVRTLQMKPKTGKLLHNSTYLEQEAQSVSLLTIDQSERCGFRRNDRVINL